MLDNQIGKTQQFNTKKKCIIIKKKLRDKKIVKLIYTII